MIRTHILGVLLFSMLVLACFVFRGASGAEDNESSAVSAEAISGEQVALDDPPDGLHRIVVRGRCYDDLARPVENARVLILRDTNGYLERVIEGETRTDSDGNFEFAQVKTTLNEQGDLSIVAAKAGFSSSMALLKKPMDGIIEEELTMSADPGTLSGLVTDSHGRPLSGVAVYLSCSRVDAPFEGILSAVTDEDGRYEINDLKRFAGNSRANSIAGLSGWLSGVRTYFRLRHPDFGLSSATFSAIPQDVNVTLYPPAIVEGQVLDDVTKQPAADVVVSAQGIGRHGWYQTRTDSDGRYRLKMVHDHYNIWAGMDDRVPIAVKAIEVRRGETVTGADIRMMRGGIVTGRILDNGRPFRPRDDMAQYVGNYGPARPRTGAAVSSTRVEPDGTFRLRVAPGENFLYVMSNARTSAYVTVQDGEELHLDLTTGHSQGMPTDEADKSLGQRIFREAMEEDARERMREENFNR